MPNRPVWLSLAIASLALGACAPAAVPNAAPMPTPVVMLAAPTATVLAPTTASPTTAAPTADVANATAPAPVTPTPTEVVFIQAFPTPDQFGFRRSDPAEYRRVSGRVQLVEFFSVLLRDVPFYATYRG